MKNGSITVLLRDWSSGSGTARDELMGLVYQELKTISRRTLRRESSKQVTATALVHEMFLKLSRYDSMDWESRTHFFAFCAGLMRQILTDAARARLTGKRHAWFTGLPDDNQLPWLGTDPSEYLELNRALDKLASLEPEKAQVVELRLYMGCTASEAAEALGISKATVDRHMTVAKAFLFRELHPES